MRVSIVETYTVQLQPVNQLKKRHFLPTRSQHLTVTPKSEKLPKMIFGKVKADTP